MTTYVGSETLEVRDLVEADIAEIPALFDACYGNTYSNPMFYDEAALRTAVASGRLRPVVAEWRGRIAGHMALTVRHAGARVCEAGNTVVHPDARGRGVMPRLAVALHDRTRREGFVGYVHYPTTAHDIMQRASVLNGGVETGVMLSYVPADTEYAQFSNAGLRLAVTVAFQPLGALPVRELARLPRRYEGLLRQIYGQCDLRRVIAPTNGPSKCTERSEISHAFSARRDALQIDIESVGEDFEEVVRALLSRFNAAAAYADLPVDLPGIDRAIDALRTHGFFFAALLPEFWFSDVLRLQRIREGSPDVLNPRVSNDGARKLLELIREEISI